jgi:signal transduction histidine kinase
MLLADLVIGAAYLWVALALYVFARRRPDFPYPRIMMMFAAVFAACGLSHLTDAATLWLPWYGAQAMFKAVVAVVSIPAALAMWRLVPQALLLPSPAHLAKVNAELAAEVAQHRVTERELRTAKEAAEAASRAKSDFLATISHELRTPLNAVIGFADGLRHGYFGPLAEKQLGYIGAIHTSGVHLLRLINDILDISKIDSGKFAIDDEPVDLGALVQSCLSLLQPRAAEAEVTISVRSDQGDQPMVHGDPMRLKQVLLNLMDNAVKFTPKGGSVTISAARDGDGGMRLTVADTGIGMRAEDIPKAFEMFSQIENPMTRRFGGTGVGLPLTRALVALHGGAIEVDSAPGAGTRVTVLLPPERVLA